MTDYLIGIDLGGTRLRAACLDDQLNILHRIEKLTLAEEGREATIQRIKDAIAEVLPEDKSTVRGIGVSVPGPSNPETGVVVAPPNLPGWRDVPLVDILNKEFDLPVYLGNDANVAALAEVALGSAQDYKHAIYLTVSTGIGGGVINDERLILGQTGIGNEVGHMVMLVDDGDKSRVSTLEKEAAGPALVRQARERIEAGAESKLVEMANGDLDAMDGKMIGDAANAGDPLAIDIVKRGGSIVGMGIVNLLHIFNPEAVIIGGGVSYIGDIWFDEVMASIKAYTIDDDYWQNTPIIQSKISEDVSILGSALLVLTKGSKRKLSKALKNMANTESGEK
ncbi:MAG: ROK family protein [Chloroflexota bacterium]